ncbi:hypothetical protein IPH25_04940 [bacterium]|nr:MAG: hypothetical protein IPH25_04940 [bacterium]
MQQRLCFFFIRGYIYFLSGLFCTTVYSVESVPPLSIKNVLVEWNSRENAHYENQLGFSQNLFYSEDTLPRARVFSGIITQDQVNDVQLLNPGRLCGTASMAAGMDSCRRMQAHQFSDSLIGDVIQIQRYSDVHKTYVFDYQKDKKALLLPWAYLKQHGFNVNVIHSCCYGVQSSIEALYDLTSQTDQAKMVRNECGISDQLASDMVSTLKLYDINVPMMSLDYSVESYFRSATSLVTSGLAAGAAYTVAKDENLSLAKKVAICTSIGGFQLYVRPLVARGLGYCFYQTLFQRYYTVGDTGVTDMKQVLEKMASQNCLQSFPNLHCYLSGVKNDFVSGSLTAEQIQAFYEVFKNNLLVVTSKEIHTHLDQRQRDSKNMFRKQIGLLYRPTFDRKAEGEYRDILAFHQVQDWDGLIDYCQK